MQALKMAEQWFAKLQRTRTQTEARVAIFLNGFLDTPMGSKGIMNRDRDIGWAVLAHNLWMIDRLPKLERRKEE